MGAGNAATTFGISGNPVFPAKRRTTELIEEEAQRSENQTRWRMTILTRFKSRP
jgi:hypothetical protein